MSNWREEFEDGSGVGAVTAWLTSYYHYVALAALAGFTLWNRTRFWGRFVVDGRTLLAGNDPFYHLRSVQYVVNNYPATMPFDPWTYFSLGTANSQFGTLYDQLMATAALVVGLGSPSDELVRTVVLFAPAIFGAAVMVPAYLIGRRLGGRAGGVVSAAIIALGAGGVLQQGMAGSADHQVAEALFQALAVLGVVVALAVARREKPVWELVQAREVAALRRSLGWATLAGVAVAAYLWVWPPGVLLLGVLGLFFLVHLSVEYVRGNSPEHAAFVGAVALATAGVLQLPTLNTLELSATSRSVLQPGLAVGVAAGCVFVAWLARRWDGSDRPARLFPLLTLGIVTVVAVLTAVVLPDTFGYFVTQVDRVLGFFTGQSAQAATVVEARPGSLDTVYQAYKLAAATALLGAVVLLARQVLDDDPGGEGLLVVLLAAVMLSATLTQGRFAYYMAVPVGVLNAALVGWAVGYIGGIGADGTVETYQVLSVGVVILVVLAPMLLIFPTATAVAQQNQAPGGVTGWQSSLEWMEENTPAEGQYGNPDGDPMAYYGAFSRTDDYDYRQGAYGVMSWWDYGHWITGIGERIPTANPFQQGATEAARFLLAQDETEAAGVLSEIDEDDATTRYVMIDSQMVGGKYQAPPQFAPNVTRSDFFTRSTTNRQVYRQYVRGFQQRGLSQSRANRQARGIATVRHQTQAYYESMMVRLYAYHGSSMEPQPYVVDWQQVRTERGGAALVEPDDGPMFRAFENMSAAREYARQDGTAAVGGFGPYPPEERVAALDNYRLVQTSSSRSGKFARDVLGAGYTSNAVLQQLGNRSPAARQYLRDLTTTVRSTDGFAKVFERVPGAQVQGDGAPGNATLTMQVRMEPANGPNFTYSKRVETDDTGAFETTVPYSTTGYENWGPEQGRTNVSVRATGPYTVSSGLRTNETGSVVSYRASVDVTEAQVIGENTTPVQVTLDEQPLNIEGASGGSGNTSGTDTGADGTGIDGGDNTTGSVPAGPVQTARTG
ncbi:MAG: oligosaccharyl transferase (archaeosortase A-associated) [Salinirussus sp.]|jgi:oligosaccharyl transferase (archaeosortase A-associated)